MRYLFQLPSGGICSVSDARNLLCQADKVALNTAAIKNPNLIKDLVRNFGISVLLYQFKLEKYGTNEWEAMTEMGREKAEKMFLNGETSSRPWS